MLLHVYTPVDSIWLQPCQPPTVQLLYCFTRCTVLSGSVMKMSSSQLALCWFNLS